MSEGKSRLKLFISNFFAFGVIGALNGAIPILMLPLVTRFIGDTADYGRFDMFNTLVGFGGQLASFGIYDAAFREYFEKEDAGYKSTVLSTSLKLQLFSVVLVAALMTVFAKPLSAAFLGDSGNTVVVWFAAGTVLLTAIGTAFSFPMKFHNQRSLYAVSGVLRSGVLYGLSMVFLLRGFSYMGMIWGTLLAAVFSLLFFLFVCGKHFHLSLHSAPVAKELLRIGIPLAPVFLVYWVFNSMDKLMITNLLGLGEVGVYSAGAKIAMASQLIYTAFAGGWQYFAFSTMRESDQVAYNSKIFEYLGVISYAATFIGCLLDGFVFHLFFEGEYVRGVSVFPFLFLAPLLLMLYQTAGNQLLVVKKNHLFLLGLIPGVLTNLGINFWLIPTIGISGAAFATLCGYLVSVIGICMITYRLGLMELRGRFVGLSAYMFAVMLIELMTKNRLAVGVLSVLGLSVLAFAYRSDLAMLAKSLKKKPA